MLKTSRFGGQRRRLGSLLLASSLAVATIAITAGQATAEFDVVERVATPNPDYSNRFEDVSCTSANFCVGAGSKSLQGASDTAFIASWDGASWTQVTAPAGWSRVSDVDCLSSTFCMLVGMNSNNFGDSAVFDGSTVGAGQSIVGVAQANGVSCISATSCIAVGSTYNSTTDYVSEWNGTSWSAVNTGLTTNVNERTLNDIECDGSGACVAVGADRSNNPYVSRGLLMARSSAGVWSVPTRAADNLGDLSVVSCRPVTAGVGNDDTCVAYAMSNTDYSSPANALLFNQVEETFGTLPLPQIPQPSNSLRNSLSFRGFECFSSTRCLAVGYQMLSFSDPLSSYVGVWDGTTWTRLTSPTAVGETSINDLACFVSTCMGVGMGKTAAGMAVQAPTESWAWKITDSAASVTTTTTTVAPTTTTAAPVATTTTAAPVATTTTAAPVATTTTAAPSSSMPPPALSTVQALPTAPTPIVADTSISIGEEISVSFGGFTPYEFVQLIVASTPQVIGSGYANAQGVVTLSGNLPSNLAAGNHTLAVYAPGSGIGFTQPISVSQPTLPATGSDGNGNLYVIALLLFALGLVVRRTSVTANKH
jgi:LPXTG-motif cell wall-anchored protein